MYRKEENMKISRFDVTKDFGDINLRLGVFWIYIYTWLLNKIYFH